MMKKSSKFHLKQSDLLCKNQCGFYGNTAWKGYCSVCYKSLSGRRSHSSVHRPSVESHTAKTVSNRRAIVNSDQNFSKFEEKRRQQSERKTGTVRSLFSKSAKKDKVELVTPTSSKKGVHHK